MVAREDLRNTTMNLLLQNGYFDQRAIGGAPERGVILTPPPEAAIVRSLSGESLHFDTASTAFDR